MFSSHESLCITFIATTSTTATDFPRPLFPSKCFARKTPRTEKCLMPDLSSSRRCFSFIHIQFLTLFQLSSRSPARRKLASQWLRKCSTRPERSDLFHMEDAGFAVRDNGRENWAGKANHMAVLMHMLWICLAFLSSVEEELSSFQFNHGGGR